MPQVIHHNIARTDSVPTDTAKTDSSHVEASFVPAYVNGFPDSTMMNREYATIDNAPVMVIPQGEKPVPYESTPLHGFRGNANIAIALIKERIYLSIGEKFNAKAVNIIPKDLLLVETDESNLSIDDICSRIALYRVTTAEEIKKIAGENASTCFNL